MKPGIRCAVLTKERREVSLKISVFEESGQSLAMWHWHCLKLCEPVR